jgi:hypothetical protein
MIDAVRIWPVVGTVYDSELTTAELHCTTCMTVGDARRRTLSYGYTDNSSRTRTFHGSISRYVTQWAYQFRGVCVFCAITAWIAMLYVQPADFDRGTTLGG